MTVLNYMEAVALQSSIEPTISVARAFFVQPTRRPAAYLMLDDSMQASGILRGDFILFDVAFDANREPEEGTIVLVQYEEKTLVRHWYHHANSLQDTIELSPASPEAETIRVPAEQRAEIRMVGWYCGLVSTGRRKPPPQLQASHTSQ